MHLPFDCVVSPSPGGHNTHLTFSLKLKAVRAWLPAPPLRSSYPYYPSNPAHSHIQVPPHYSHC